VDGDDEPICVVSEFDPEVSWDGRNAMQRNATIAALSDLVVIVASGMQGGTWEMAQLCAKRKKSLFIVDFDPSVAPGNRMLIKSLGAEAVALGELERCWTTPLPAVGSGSAQDRLF
jgi:predicted Rossmann fold nucleotide-binding protein DprA/Smf involved in DNA uptake